MPRFPAHGRLGPLPKAGVELVPGAEVVATTRPGEATARLLPSVFTELPQAVRPGHPVLLAEGRMRLKVIAAESRGEDWLLKKVTSTAFDWASHAEFHPT